MKKKYIRPNTVIMPVEIENLMNTGSDYDGTTGKSDSLGQGEGPGETGEGGYIWGDAKPHNVWSDGGVQDFDDSFQGKW